jgi:hypothetical protein
VWGPRIVVGACTATAANDYIVSFCSLRDGFYIINKFSLIGDCGMDNISNGVDVVCK